MGSDPDWFIVGQFVLRTPTALPWGFCTTIKDPN
jgi:hypothetical protein